MTKRALQFPLLLAAMLLSACGNTEKQEAAIRNLAEHCQAALSVRLTFSGFWGNTVEFYCSAFEVTTHD